MKVDQKELSQPKKGLYILTLNTTNGEYETTSFDQPMKHFFWDPDRRKTNRLKFINYFLSLANNTVIVFVTKGLCKYSDFGDWISYLEKDTDLVFKRKDYEVNWMSAVVVACKTNCPKDVRPITIYAQHAVINVTFGTNGNIFTDSCLRSDCTSILRVCSSRDPNRHLYRLVTQDLATWSICVELETTTFWSGVDCATN